MHLRLVSVSFPAETRGQVKHERSSSAFQPIKRAQPVFLMELDMKDSRLVSPSYFLFQHEIVDTSCTIEGTGR
jgi:hypothetical protein